MLAPFWLIQRGFIKKIVPTASSRLDDFIELDYMGHAEFEFGAISRSLARILDRFKDYEAFPTDLFSADDKRVFVFTKNENVPKLIVNFADRMNPDRFDLKDPSFLEDVRKTNAYAKKHRFPSFWFCIDNSYDQWSNFKNGDWMAMFEDDIPTFLKIMKNEKAIWDSYPESERQKLLNY